MGYLLLFVAVLSCTTAWAVICAVGGKIAGYPVPRATLGFGPRWASVRIAGIDVELRLVPLGGTVDLVEPPDDPEAEPAGLPLWLAVAPHLVVASIAAPLAPLDQLQQVAAWAGGVLGLTEPGVGLFGGLAAAAAAATSRPVAVFATTAVLFGASNVVFGAVHWLATRSRSTAALVAYVLTMASLFLALLARGVWLDL